jgi:hypothetical protein
LKQKGNKIFVTYKGFVNEYKLLNKPLGLYDVETFLLDLQRPTRGVGRSSSARISRNTAPRYIGEDGAPPTPAFTHYQGFDQPGPSELRHRAWEDQTSYDPPTPEENWGHGNFSNYVPQEYEDSAYIQRGHMSFQARGVHDAAPTPPPYSYHASHGYLGY